MKLVTDTKKIELYHWCIGDALKRGNFFQVGNAAWIHWLHTAAFTDHSTILADELSLCWAVLSYLTFYLPLMSPVISLCPLLQWSPAGIHHTQHNLPHASELQKHFLHMQMTAVVYVAQRSNESPPWHLQKTPRWFCTPCSGWPCWSSVTSCSTLHVWSRNSAGSRQLWKESRSPVSMRYVLQDTYLPLSRLLVQQCHHQQARWGCS